MDSRKTIKNDETLKKEVYYEVINDRKDDDSPLIEELRAFLQVAKTVFDTNTELVRLIKKMKIEKKLEGYTLLGAKEYIENNDNLEQNERLLFWDYLSLQKKIEKIMNKLEDKNYRISNENEKLSPGEMNEIYGLFNILYNVGYSKASSLNEKDFSKLYNRVVKIFNSL